MVIQVVDNNNYIANEGSNEIFFFARRNYTDFPLNDL